MRGWNPSFFAAALVMLLGVVAGCGGGGSHGLAEAPWPKFHQNNRNVGVSPHVGAQTATLRWKYQTGDYIQSSPAVAADGTVYVGSWDRYLYAIGP